MTTMAVFKSPCRLFVVTHTTKLTFKDGGHGNVIGPYLHLKAKFMVTYLAPETDPVKPVGINHRPCPLRFGVAVEYNIGILCHPRRSGQQKRYRNQEQDRWGDASISVFQQVAHQIVLERYRV